MSMSEPRRVLCLLLSEQHIPNLLSGHHFKPQRLVLVVSDRMRKQKRDEAFLEALRMGGLEYAERTVKRFVSDVAGFEEVGRVLRSAFGEAPDAEWICNITGGTKPMSIAAYELFKALGCRIVYIELSRPDEIIDVTDGHVEPCAYRPSCAEFCAGYGYRQYRKNKSLNAARERANRWWETARRLTLTCASENLLRLPRDAWGDARKRGRMLRPGELVLPDERSRELVRSTFGLSPAGESLVGELDKYACSFLTGEWLEVFLWGVLERHAEQLGIWDVQQGLMPGTDHPPGNELDVAFMHRQGLWVVECKTGDQEGVDVNSVIYKIDSVVRQLGALRVRFVIATTSNNVMQDDGGIREAVKNRIDNLRGILLTPDALREMAQQPESVDLVRARFRL